MSFKNMFTSEEWSLLEDSVLLTFKSISGADNKIDKKEIRAFHAVVTNHDKIENKLASEILSGIESWEKNYLQHEVDNSMKTYHQITDLLDSKIDHNEVVNFKKTIVSIGIYVANASGDWFGPKMSESEGKKIKAISEALALNIEDLQSQPSIHKMLTDFNDKFIIV